MLDDIPFEVVHTVLQYISASDIAAVRLVATRLKVLHPYPDYLCARLLIDSGRGGLFPAIQAACCGSFA